MVSTRFINTLIAAGILLAGCEQRPAADTIIYNAVVYTVDSAMTVCEAIAIKDGKILATGSNEQIGKYEAAERVDAHGSALYPGFIDAHAHFVGYGRSLFEVNLYDCKTWDEAVERVSSFAAQHPSEVWIRGRGWDQHLFPGGAWPDNKKLNELFPDKPVLLQRIDGHAAIANTKALEMAGVKAGTALNGGKIELENGKPTGLLIDNAVDLVTRIIPVAGKAAYAKWLQAADSNCLAAGLTTVADCGLPYHDITMIDTLQQEGRVHMRVYALLSDDGKTYDEYMAARTAALAGSNEAVKACYAEHGPYKTERLYVKGVKAYADGALGSRGACLLHHYTDKPGWGGFLLGTQAHYDSLAAMLLPTDMQLCTHAIGDSGNRMVLEVYGRYLPQGNDRRWRIEHAQVVAHEDFDRFGAHSIVPSVQPTHATSDMYWAGERLGPERLGDAYAYRRLLEQNGWLPLGTDFPVEDISPFKTFYAATARMDAKGYPEGGFQPQDALTREQALRGMTIWAAKGCFMENEVGSLEPGKKADFILLDHDIMKVPAAQLLATKATAVWLGGVRVH